MVETTLVLFLVAAILFEISNIRLRRYIKTLEAENEVLTFQVNRLSSLAAGRWDKVESLENKLAQRIKQVRRLKERLKLCSARCGGMLQFRFLDSEITGILAMMEHAAKVLRVPTINWMHVNRGAYYCNPGVLYQKMKRLSNERENDLHSVRRH